MTPKSKVNMGKAPPLMAPATSPNIISVLSQVVENLNNLKILNYLI